MTDPWSRPVDELPEGYEPVAQYSRPRHQNAPCVCCHQGPAGRSGSIPVCYACYRDGRFKTWLEEHGVKSEGTQ